MKQLVMRLHWAVVLLILSAILPISAKAQATPTPEPTVSDLAPLSVVANGTAFKLTVKGTGFANNATVYWNEVDLPTTFVSATELTVIVPGALRKNEGYASITVHQGDAVTARVGLAIHAPAPALRSVQPASAPVKAGEVPITVTGVNFAKQATLLCNGVALPTTFVSAKELRGTVPATNTAKAGFLRLQVRQGGITSKVIAFVVGSP